MLFIGKLERLTEKAIGTKLPTELTGHYSSIFNPATFTTSSSNVYANAHIHRVFNEEGDVANEFNKDVVAPVTGLLGLFPTYILDLTEVHLGYGIPIGYFLEVLLISLTVKSGSKQFETLIYPDELKYLELSLTPLKASTKMSTLVKGNVNVLKELGSTYEVIDHLRVAGLQDMAADLLEGLRRFYSSDYEGSIKFFRKVVEGLRKVVDERDVFEGNRKELLHQYLSTAYRLISNFGEHAGTSGSLHEARLSRDIALSLSRYLAEYLRLKQGG
ncbi:MAG: hypothetical protein RXP86_11595 [Acidilobus sp.]